MKWPQEVFSADNLSVFETVVYTPEGFFSGDHRVLKISWKRFTFSENYL
jgi:hypothetical protein